MRRMKTLGALIVGGALALAGCSGSDGSAGAPGTNGTNGTNGATGINGATGQKLKLVIDGVTTANGTATLNFTVYPAANVCPGGTCDDTLSILGQKTFYAQQYDANARAFNKAGNNFSFGGIHFSAITADGKGAQYTATKASPPFTVETSTSAYVYGYIATKGAVPAPTTGHYSLPSSVASASKVYGTITYSSYANVAGCEKCHNKPYSKHGYRQATVAGLPDFVSCKVCHPDDTAGEDGQWYVFADDPASYDPDTWDTTKYAYKKNIMNDVHNSHAMEFNYPQFMANCVTCHAGKLTNVLDDSCFRPSVCKSCHPVTGVAGTQEGRAPALLSIIPHNVGDLYTAAENACSGCHVTGNTVSAPLFKDFHPGYNVQVYKDANGGRYDATYVTTVDAVSYDLASYVATVDFTISGLSTTANAAAPRAYAGVYGWDTKDFIARLDLTPVKQADQSKFRVVANVSAYAAAIAAGEVTRIEVFLMPVVGQNQALAANTTTNLAVAAAGASQTVDVTKTNTNLAFGRPDAKGNPVWYKGIVDPNKCKACHDSLGTFWWHAPRNGSAGVVGCRVCHNPITGAGYYEMQSKSIDSFLHGAHMMEMGEIAKNYDPTNAVSNVRWEKHVEGNFPNFAGLLNCEACHYPGTYNPPDQAKSMPSLLSGLTAGLDRPLGAFGAQIVGPAARACGGCHRAAAINELDGTKLAAFVAHTNDFGSTVDPSLSVTTTAEYIMGLIGAGPGMAPVAGAQVERCMICHPTSGSDHQNLFNIWANGIKQ